MLQNRSMCFTLLLLKVEFILTVSDDHANYQRADHDWLPLVFSAVFYDEQLLHVPPVSIALIVRHTLNDNQFCLFAVFKSVNCLLAVLTNCPVGLYWLCIYMWPYTEQNDACNFISFFVFPASWNVCDRHTVQKCFQVFQWYLLDIDNQ